MPELCPGGAPPAPAAARGSSAYIVSPGSAPVRNPGNPSNPGFVPGKNAGRAPGENSGRAPGENSGFVPVANSGFIPAEDAASARRASASHHRPGRTESHA